MGSIGSDGEPASWIASSEDSYNQTVTGCEVARGCPVAGRLQCLQTIGVAATAAGLHRKRVRENPLRGAAVHARPHFKAKWVQKERLRLPPAPSLRKADTSGTREPHTKAFSLCVQKGGASHNAWEAFPTKRGGGLSRWVPVRLVPTGHGGAGGGRRGGAPPPPKCACWGRSALSPLLDGEQGAGRDWQRCVSRGGPWGGNVARNASACGARPCLECSRLGAAVPTRAQQTKSCSSTTSNEIQTDFH